jgi:endonuclease YncB( thermonuclease family)
MGRNWRVIEGGRRDLRRTWRGQADRRSPALQRSRGTVARLLLKTRPFALFAGLLAIWPAADPALVEPPAFLATGPEPIDEQFTRCGRGRGHACVIDGDTFKLGQRKVRIIGIDTPEVAAQCPKEALAAEAATAELQRLLNQGPFDMVGRIDEPTDRYRRDLRAITRTRADGTTQSIAGEMRDGGFARRYLGGYRSGWCD